MSRLLPGRRVGRIVAVQLSVSLLTGFAGLAFGYAGGRALFGPRPVPAAGFALFGVGVASLVVAALPWIWPALTVAIQRLATWSILGLATIVVVLSSLVLEWSGFLGCQLLLGAGVLSEVGGRRHALRWFWLCVILAGAAIVLYLRFAPLRPGFD
jgi:hypothetical protein